jgi:anti-sigma B factor antagonist
MTGESRQVHAEPGNGLCLLCISGQLDPAAAGSLAERAGAALRAAPGPVLVDLSGLTFIDAHGARALAALTRTLTGRPASVPFCPPVIRRILDLLDLPLNCLSAGDGPAQAAPASEPVEQARRARRDASQARLTSTEALARLTITRIRLASTRERAELTREQGRRTIASSRMVRDQLTPRTPGNNSGHSGLAASSGRPSAGDRLLRQPSPTRSGYLHSPLPGAGRRA